MTPRFMKNLRNKRGMRFRESIERTLIGIIFVLIFFCILAYIQWLEESIKLSHTLTKLDTREQQIVALLNERTISTGGGDYVQCRQISLVKGI